MHEIERSLSTLDNLAEEMLTTLEWTMPVDVFAEQPVPPLPLDCLPAPFAKYANECSAASGFDVGGYSLLTLISACNHIDHRARMEIAPGFEVPAFAWLGLVAKSGAGKSPIMKASRRFAEAINAEMLKSSQSTQAEHAAGNRDTRPRWRQRHADDTTTEALAKLLIDNPEGVNLFHDEITRFIGQLDAYGNAGGGKDRGVFLQAFDGGSVTVNRAKAAPMFIEQFSVGIIAGMQPDVLADLFRKTGGGADGLYQRFLVYQISPPNIVNYESTHGLLTAATIQNIFSRIQEWNDAGIFTEQKAKLAPDARKGHADYLNQIRIITARTPAKRLAEHLDKFPGFLGRLAFGLHCVECAVNGEYLAEVSIDTFERAKRILRVLYRHSEAVYLILDRGAGDVLHLVRSAAEAILSKGWERFQRGDLTRYATDWRGRSDQTPEAALDLLIELGWLADITENQPGKRGRKSDGKFLVNPQAHLMFSEHAERITRERAERFEAIKALAA
ncbi:DUF3987 domain-containing protein [Dechloromonas sp. TW-R-39-2]|uniref:DUF3987 domain-containing protein n=1 Tax=Dechloromonas sp. TW-R-39-2 TaxID=2654218 RepID=UPI00193E49E7|nr:DUF3987 domain-containing protein [Dechloromonas sp. TW-R-39-2]QRM20667.1 DUF3987 domain-containing protein [Dechloromonas sp. TW-R-39-2]